MKLSSEHLTLTSQDGGMSFQVEGLQLGNLPHSMVQKNIEAFLQEKGLVEGFQPETLIDLLDNSNHEDGWKGVTLAAVAKPRLDWLGGQVILGEPDARKIFNDIEKFSSSWSHGKSPSAPHFFTADDVIAQAWRPSPNNCMGEPSKSWDPVAWLDTGENLKWVSEGDTWNLIAKSAGYLFVEKGVVDLLSLISNSEDGMEQFLLILPPANNVEIWKELIQAKVAEHNKKTDFSSQKLKIAEGSSPTPAVKGGVEQLLPAKGSWHQEVDAGDVLAVLTPHQSPKAGLTVLGDPIPPSEKELPPIEFPLGEGVNKETLDDGKVIFTARFRGVALHRDGILSVAQTLDLTGDLTPELGNIRFDGQVTIGGDVLSGATIECGHLVVRGTVENQVQLIAKKSILIEGGVVGEQTELRAPDIVVRLVQGASLVASKSLEVQHYSYGASLLSLGDIKVLGESLPKDHNALVGGTCSAFGNLHLHSVGSNMSSTLVAAGIDLPLWESCEKLKVLARQLHRDIQEIQSSLPMDLLREEGLKALNGEERKKMETSLKDMKEKISRRSAVLEKLHESRDSCLNPNGGFIKVDHKLEPDVSSMIGEVQGLHRQVVNGPVKFTQQDDQVEYKLSS